MKKISILLSIFIFAAINLAQSQQHAYVLYNAKGKKVKYKKMIKKLAKKDVILFGETHDNPISHWLQYELTADLYKKRQLVLGAEMFEADNQQPLSDYVDTLINYEVFDSLARLWSNYKTDYAPLVDFAIEKELDFIATNIPRRYAKLVYKKGFEGLDTLSDLEKSWMAPLPMPFDSEIKTYKAILEMMGDHGTPELVMAQATKDATMAYFILKNYVEGKLFIHYNGSFHSDFYEGIMWYLKRNKPDLKYGTITTVSQEDVTKLLDEHKHKADYIICVDSDMTTTY